MSLNASTVNDTGAIHTQTMIVDSIPQTHPFQLPLDVISIILKNLPGTMFPDLALVCKPWKVIVDNDDFLNKMLTPPNFNGPQRWLEYTKANVGEAPALPRWVYKCMRKGGHMLTYIPETVKILNADGTEKEVSINSLEVVGNLFTHTINGRTIGIDPLSTDAIQMVIHTEKGYWALISKKATDQYLDYNEQVAKAKEMGASMSGAIETAISVFMEYLRTGELHFKREFLFIRVEAIRLRLWLNLDSSGLCVGGIFDHETYHPFALARKIFAK